MRWLVLLLLLTGCKEDVVAKPDPVALTEESLGYYCQMNIVEHDGPKGQIHLVANPQPLFFGQVRDVVAYLKGPERDAEISAIYVSDMGAAQSWAKPGTTNWIDATSAVFVVGAGVRGGMGAPEIVPFLDPENAKAFTQKYGGTVMSLDEIPIDAAIGPIDLDQILEDPE